MTNMNLPLEDTPVSVMRGRIVKPTLLLSHILAGRSVLTVRSKKTGERFTYRFARPKPEKDKPRPVWISVLSGPDNNHHWSMIGTFWPEQANSPHQFKLKLSPKCMLGGSSPAVLGAAWAVCHVPQADVLLEQGEWWHEGRCGRCGRRLTVPESIETGFGPECRDLMGM